MNISEKFKNRVLVIGDIIYDRYWYTEVNRISPEAPVPIAQYLREEMKIESSKRCSKLFCTWSKNNGSWMCW